jgi:ribosomal protein S18 acetylase RimI-like enzyme
MAARSLGDGIEVDDDRARIDVVAVHAFLSGHASWAQGRALAVQERLVAEATRVVGLYDNGRQIGFCRAVSDGVAFAYLADVYVLPDYRGRRLGEALVREMVEGGGALRERRWLLHTGDAHALYRKFGWGDPSERVMERPPD